VHGAKSLFGVCGALTRPHMQRTWHMLVYLRTTRVIVIYIIKLLIKEKFTQKITLHYQLKDDDGIIASQATTNNNIKSFFSKKVWVGKC
jgi:hypothetical protein